MCFPSTSSISLYTLPVSSAATSFGNAHSTHSSSDLILPNPLKAKLPEEQFIAQWTEKSCKSELDHQGLATGGRGGVHHQPNIPKKKNCVAFFLFLKKTVNPGALLSSLHQKWFSENFAVYLQIDFKRVSYTWWTKSFESRVSDTCLSCLANFFQSTVVWKYICSLLTLQAIVCLSLHLLYREHFFVGQINV